MLHATSFVKLKAYDQNAVHAGPTACSESQTDYTHVSCWGLTGEHSSILDSIIVMQTSTIAIISASRT